MKVEVGSFTPASATATIVLDDSTINVKFVHFQVSKNGSNVNFSSGFSDSIKNRSAYATYNASKKSGRSTTYSIYHYDASTLKLAGKIPSTGFDTAGEFTINFDNYDNTYTVDFVVIGE